ncbi:MAG: calcium-binding protein [Richelia sp. SM1_7_0]|nr:calcium-binding protein [Richelia sp. SM1_7_0]
MPDIAPDKSREERIDMEVVVDAYNEDERVMGWYYYLEDKLQFPFKAKWVNRQRPQGKEVEVVEMSPSDECMRSMFVEVRYREGEVDDIFSARLEDIHPIAVDEETAEAIADWHYWVDMGYEF